jgi:urease accessory protein
MTTPMWTATDVERRASDGARTAIVSDTITLDRAGRYRRRVALTTDGGQPLLLDLPKATYLADGDLLVAGSNRIMVRAATEPLMEVRADSAAQLARIAWHIGNRHTPAEVADNALYLQLDHVLAEMIAGLGGHVQMVVRAFEPEGGAYGGHTTLSRGHHHHGDAGSVHGHGHSHETAPAANPDADPAGGHATRQLVAEGDH